MIYGIIIGDKQKVKVCGIKQITFKKENSYNLIT